jgi:N-acetylglucosamine malate deacetylase 2
MKKFLAVLVRVCLLMLLAPALLPAQASAAAAPASAAPVATSAAEHPPRVLLVVAHPDDESCFAATVYEITHNLGGTVDQLVITDGEGGYRYSLLAESFYGVALTDEAVGRAALPEIRKRELLEAGRILGIRNHFFLDEPDRRYTQDIDEVLDQHWNSQAVLAEVARRVDGGHYDFVFTLFPSPETHGAHKAATLTALSAVQQMSDAAERPVVLGCQDAPSAEKQPSWQGFLSARHRFTVDANHVYVTDRTVKFGFRDALDYQIVVNWVIAAHKSQGLFQMGMNRAEREEFVVLESGAADEASRSRELFRTLAEHAAHPRGLAAFQP